MSLPPSFVFCAVKMMSSRTPMTAAQNLKERKIGHESCRGSCTRSRTARLPSQRGPREDSRRTYAGVQTIPRRYRVRCEVGQQASREMAVDAETVRRYAE